MIRHTQLHANLRCRRPARDRWSGLAGGAPLVEALRVTDRPQLRDAILDHVLGAVDPRLPAEHQHTVVQGGQVPGAGVAAGGRVLFRPELGAGAHVGPAGRYDQLRYEAEILSFLVTSRLTAWACRQLTRRPCRSASR